MRYNASNLHNLASLRKIAALHARGGLLIFPIELRNLHEEIYDATGNLVESSHDNQISTVDTFHQLGIFHYIRDLPTDLGDDTLAV